ncbi:MAG: PHP domain-containing protein, partial [Bacilli bacterium]|nr:PHP domain-containing protein [Bacilli bacterium]
YYLENEKEVIEEIINKGLTDGLECMHSFINEEKSDYLIKLCDQHKLYKSGGSDFHDDSIAIGTSNYGKKRIPFDLVKDWS